MLGKAARKAMAVGRFASAVFGLALVLALVVGVASAAFGANGGNFVLGQNNAATVLTKLTGNVNGGGALQVVNDDPGANDWALTLSVQDGETPLRVSSDARVSNLNADKLDGKDSQAFLPSNIYEVSLSRLVSPNSERYATVDCDDGDLIIGGGFGGLEPRSVALQSERGDNEWQLGILNGASNLTDQVRLQAVCADYPPQHN